MQLFTHLLSSYLQGMGDFFSALLWGGLGWGSMWLAMTVPVHNAPTNKTARDTVLLHQSRAVILFFLFSDYCAAERVIFFR